MYANTCMLYACWYQSIIQDPKQGGVSYVLSEWPNSAEEEFVTKMLETGSGITEEWRSKSVEECVTCIFEMTWKKRHAFNWEPMAVSGYVSGHIDEINRQLKAAHSRKSPWDYTHLLGGFTGSRVAYTDGETVVLKSPEVRAMVSCVYVATRGVLSNL